ncbi:MAG: hypothetical protein ACPL1B_09565, partial [Thermoprotei archaeon]
MSKKIFNFVVILLLIVFISNFASPILNKSSSFQKVYAKSEDLDKETLISKIYWLYNKIDQDNLLVTYYINNLTSVYLLISPSKYEKYEWFVDNAINLRGLALNSLRSARKYIEANDLVNANSSYQDALILDSASWDSLSAASGVLDNTIADIEKVVRTVYEAFKLAGKITASLIPGAEWVTTAVFMATDYAVNSSTKGADKAIQEFQAQIITKGIIKIVEIQYGISLPSVLSANSNISDILRSAITSELFKDYLVAKLGEATVKELLSNGLTNAIIDNISTLSNSSSSQGTGGGMGGGGGGSWGQSLDKVQLSSPQNALVLQPGNINFSWNSVNNATKYEFLLYNYLGQVIQDRTTSYYNTSIAITFSAEGTFTWRVRAGDDYDNWGPWSDTWSVIIRNTSTQLYFKVLVDRGCGSTYKIGDIIKISGESNITANGTLYSYWSDGSVKTYPAPFMANQTVPLVSSPLDGATGLRRYKVVVNYQGQTYESNECIISIVDSTTTLGQVQLSSPGNGSTLPPGNITFIWNSVNNATKYEFILY